MRILILLLSIFFCGSIAAQTLTVNVNRTAKNDKTASIGQVTFKDSSYGLLIEPKLHGLKPGMHGLHVHQKPDCGNLGMNAGGHYDPDATGKHLGPYDDQGHLGDLPPLYVNAKGQANMTTLAPRLRVRDLIGHSIMIHEGGDNFSDTPEKLGGGGKRVACGILIEQKKK